MTSSRQIATVIAVTCSLSVSLSGCALVDGAGQVWGIIESEVAQQRALNLTVAELERIDGVQSVSSRFTADTPAGDAAELNVTAAADLSHEQAKLIAEITREAFTGPDLDTTVPLLTVSTADAGAGVLTRTFFGYSDELFADDFTYWRDVENAIGADLSMSLTSSISGGLYDRIFTWPEGTDALATSDRMITNFAALTAVHDETKSPTRWDFVGLWSYPGLLPTDAVELLDSIRGTIGLVDFAAEDVGLGLEYPEGVQLQSAMRYGDASARVAVVINQREYRDAGWENVITAGVLASSVPELNFIYTEGARQFLLHTSACAATTAESSHDRKLFDEVLASGAEFLPGAGPGLCVPEH